MASQNPFLFLAGLLLVGAILVAPKAIPEQGRPQGSAEAAADLQGTGFAIDDPGAAGPAIAPAVDADGEPDAGTDFEKYRFDPDDLAVDPTGGGSPIDATEPWPLSPSDD